MCRSEHDANLMDREVKEFCSRDEEEFDSRSNDGTIGSSRSVSSQAWSVFEELLYHLMCCSFYSKRIELMTLFRCRSVIEHPALAIRHFVESIETDEEWLKWEFYRIRTCSSFVLYILRLYLSLDRLLWSIQEWILLMKFTEKNDRMNQILEVRTREWF